MKINTILALIGVVLAVISLFVVHAWLLPSAVICIGVAYLVAPN